jgi:hypothetical protein
VKGNQNTEGKQKRQHSKKHICLYKNNAVEVSPLPLDARHCGIVRLA